MVSVGRLLAAGAGVFVLSLLLLFPARIAVGLLPSTTGSGVTGTLWNGGARSMTVAGFDLHQVSWSLRPLQLFAGRLAARLDARLPEGFLKGDIAYSLGGRISGNDIEAAAPLASLAPGMGALAGNSQLALNLSAFALEESRVAAAVGTAQLRGVVLPVPGAANLPPLSYTVTFDAPTVPDGETLVGQISDGGGPAEVTGTFKLSPGNAYEIDGRIKARPEASAELRRVLQAVGPPTGDGGHSFSLAGSF